MASAIDPFTAEIIKGGLIAASEEMFLTLQRTAKSVVIYEVLDYACGLTDARGELVSQGDGVTGFLGCLTYAVREVIAAYAEQGRLAPGDIIITNDPYGGGGSHLSDVALIAPVWAEGRIVAYVANKGHYTEVGGKDPGSWTTDATEVYQEGLQFPLVKLFEAGRPNEALLAVFAANVRTPDMTMGDLWASVAALRTGERRVLELVQQYGAATVEAAMARLIDDSERLTRRDLATLPRGTFMAEDSVDDDGLGHGPFPVRVTVTVTDDAVICDFTGTHPQVPGPINSGRTGLLSSVRSAFKALTDPAIPVNEGCFRPLRVVCPDGTLFTAQRPAPTSTYWETAEHATDLVWHALAPHVPNPERLPAGHFMSVCGTVLAGAHPESGELFLLVEPQAGGWGAGRTRDGVSGLVCAGDGETYNIPVEVAETRYGVRVNQYALQCDGAGAGRLRGGLGLVRDYEVTAEEAFLTATFGRYRSVPWGLDGGKPGSTNRIEIIRRDGTRTVHGKTARLRLARGDVARLITGTGGGCGDPRDRPRASVLADLRDGYISPAEAERVYGLPPAVIDGVSGANP